MAEANRDSTDGDGNAMDAEVSHRPILSFGRGRGRGRGGIGRGGGRNNAEAAAHGFGSQGRGRGGRGRGRAGGRGRTFQSSSWSRDATAMPPSSSYSYSKSWVRSESSGRVQSEAKHQAVAMTAVAAGREKETANNTDIDNDISAGKADDRDNKGDIQGGTSEGKTIESATKSCSGDGQLMNESQKPEQKSRPILKGPCQPGSRVWRRKDDGQSNGSNASARGHQDKIEETSKKVITGRSRAAGGQQSKRSMGRGRGSGAVAKRIRLDKPEGIVKGSSTAGGEDREARKSDVAEEPPSVALTSFAYRETGDRKRNRTHAQQQRGGNMGLVRVKTEQGRTAICPKFARGVACDSEFCMKRHDVPPECAKPLCLFFQRHGKCHKGDECPFRHVKVDASAAICSSFSLLGYCEDSTCPHKHVR